MRHRRATDINDGQEQARNLTKRIEMNDFSQMPQALRDALDGAAQRLTQDNQQNDPQEKKDNLKKIMKQFNEAKGQQVKMGQSGDPFRDGMAYLNGAIDKCMKVAALKGQADQTCKAINDMNATNTVNKCRDDVNKNGGSFTAKLFEEAKKKAGPKANHADIQKTFNKMIERLDITDPKTGKSMTPKQKKAFSLTDAEFADVPATNKDGAPIIKNGQQQFVKGTDLRANATTQDRDTGLMKAKIVVANPVKKGRKSSSNSAKPTPPSSGRNHKQQPAPPSKPGSTPPSGRPPAATPMGN